MASEKSGPAVQDDKFINMCVTYTLASVWHDESYKKQIMRLLQPFAKIIKDKHIYDFQLYFEFTQRGNMHLHGVVKCRSKYTLFKLKHLFNNGFVLVEPVKDMNNWTIYIKKEVEDMLEELDFLQLPVTKDNFPNIYHVPIYDWELGK